MRFSTSIISAAVALLPAAVHAAVSGIDVSDYQESVDFAAVKANGVEFVYIKATEGTTFVASSFGSKYQAATDAGLIRGAYHFASYTGSGAEEADHFLGNGGGWTGDGITLPGALDLEGDCGGLSAAGMINWINTFTNTYAAGAGRPPTIYTSVSWWTTCTGNTAEIGGGGVTENPLWAARWDSDSVGTLPAGWTDATFWQYADGGDLGPGDQDQFLGTSANLIKFATG